MKVILQSEAAECGSAALAMIAAAHGMNLGLPALRQRFPQSLRGTSLGSLIRMAQQLGFQTRALRLEMPDLGRLKLPCILHWDLNHFVVLAALRGRKATVLDPAIGQCRLDLKQLAGHFTGVALELAPTARFQPHAPAPAISIRRLLGPARGLHRSLLQILLLSLALQLFVLLAPFFMQWVVDQVLVTADRDLLAVLGLGFALALLLQTGTGALRGWAVIHLSSRLGLQWAGNVVSHLLRLPLDYFEKRHLGDITSRVGSVQAILKTLTTGFIEAIIDGLLVLPALALMLLYSRMLALITLLAVTLYLGVRTLAYRPLRQATRLQLLAAARQQTHLLESLRGIQTLKVAGQEAQRQDAYGNLMVNTVNQDVRAAHLGLGFSSASQLIFGAERIATIWIGAQLALHNVLSVGMLIAYLAYRDQFAQRSGALIDRWLEFRMLRLHGERLADIVLTAPEPEVLTPEPAADSNLRIEVQGLCFRYGEGDPWVLQDCCFTIEPGESLAVVGPSGCGKTTLLKLLLGLLHPTAGGIRIGGRDLRHFGARRLRAVAGAVLQDDQLFAGSVAENISCFDPDQHPDRVEAAARLAAVHEEIAAMPMGYQSLIGDMGSSLSGGQRQRVMLARALYRRPSLLFLDEATSHLDVAGERLVSEAIRHLKLTRFVVAHRHETIAAADRVLVMAGGRMVQELRNERHCAISTQ